MAFLIALMIGWKRIVPQGTWEGLRYTMVQAQFYSPNTFRNRFVSQALELLVPQQHTEQKQKQETSIILRWRTSVILRLK